MRSPTASSKAAAQPPSTQTWWTALRSYRQVAARLGHAPHTTSIDLQEQQAGRWAATCRARQIGTHNGRLSQDQVSALEASPFWYWTVTREQAWHSNYRALINFVGREHRMPVDDRRRPDEARLAGWVFTARAVRRGEARGTLTRERIELFEAIPDWTWETPETGAPVEIDNAQMADLRRAATMRAGEFRALAENAATRKQVGSTQRAMRGHHLAEYQAWVTKLGHRPQVRDDPALYEWFRRQQQAYRRRSPSMTAERIALLEAVPHWIWWTAR